MRIIGGEARGRTLVAPAGSNTRPTQDYVRESLFNILTPVLEDARVLDLFAGTGALSLEALSRGAAFAVLCDRDRAALVAIRKNVEAVRCKERCRVFAGEWSACLRSLEGGEPFDLVFLDPPYRMTETGEICARLLEAGLLAQDCRLVVEHRQGAAPATDERFRLYDQRRYGDTAISFLRLADRQGEES